MFCCPPTFCQGANHIIFLIGKKEHKAAFLKNVLEIDTKEKAFTEYKTKYKSTPLIVQSCEVDANLKELNELHSKMACGVVYLSEEDKPYECDNNMLFVLVNGKSRQESDERVIVASVQHDSYDDCKKGFGRLVDNLKKH